MVKGADVSSELQPSAHRNGMGNAPVISINGLLTRLQKYIPEGELDLIRRAYDVASKAHEGQLRDNGDPYIVHPLAVANILAKFRMDATAIAVGLLHDTVEDTRVTRDVLKNEFGSDLVGLVDGVTKLTRLELQSDRTKQAENFRKLVLAMSRDIRVLIVKLADRLHNMRTLHYVERKDRRLRIARETMDIYAPLAERIGMDRVKTELQNLAFEELEPEANATIRRRLNYLRGHGADIIEQICQDLLALLHKADFHDVEIRGREKSAYSIWAKMQQRNVAFEQLSDIMAFRIIVPTREACYAALGTIHATYPMIAGRFKDYISTPKANGYQSLHTGVTLSRPRNQKIEVQIRTPDMHNFAENGVAAHWAYKERPSAHATSTEVTPLTSVKMRWVQDLLEILEDSEAPEDFLENTKLELYQDQVFCFTPKGQLISLPRGATPIDFAYAVHSQVGDACVGAKINGRLMPLRHELQNGDQVEIMTARGGVPSPSWERFVVTGKARARIRRFIALQQRQNNIDQGRSALAKLFRQEGVDGSEKIIETTLKALKCATVEDLYVAVGGNQISPREVLNAAYPELRLLPRAPRMVPGLTSRFAAANAASARGRAASAILAGVGSGIDVQFAGCCHPLPGDQIVAAIAQGRGVTVHRRNCQNMNASRLSPEKRLSVDWNYEALKLDHSQLKFPGRFSVITADETNVLSGLTNVANKHGGNVTNIRIVNRQLDFLEIIFDVEVQDLRHFLAIMGALRSVEGVIQVERGQS